MGLNRYYFKEGVSHENWPESIDTALLTEKMLWTSPEFV